ncbi:fatty acid amide hydrolase [Caenorhabditis elegans]|uniref:fatty acid amide hydrolase n=1 Tax=Caenorhabditis elegans TaxID=6239 RepID=Q17447_CAEEL|nr:Amidase domain-containing protein [Caenorhabditis elegans]CCD61385.1 Amidase domain-containing protein [Caenorhabditis elegans]|eukprot:NP_501366.1 Fatty Acid Amide Hydrolase homolog [Caenorhabditis elegans]
MLLLLFTACLAILGAYFYRFWSTRQKRQVELQKIVDKKRAQRAESVKFAKESSEKLDKETRLKIAAMEYSELKDGLQSGKITCIDAVRTYYAKAISANEKTNSVCMFVKEAEKWAMDWDEKAKDPQFQKPPLFGLPMSLKECVPLEGYDQTRGFVQDTFRPTETDGVLVQQLKKLGAIPYVQTNVPQSLLSYNCSNPVYGTTNHPMDKTRTSGGSSGGESALISADGSLLGIGGDVGGSIRIPCAYTGTTGIKPSHLRFSHRGVCGSVPGRPLINSNDGPMSTRVETNVDFLRTVWADTWITEQDPYVPPVTWNEEAYKSDKKLKIGYYVDDGWFTPTPVCQRAVMEAKQILEDSGHTLVPFRPPRVPEVLRMFLRAVCVDAGTFLSKKLMNDIIDPLLYTQVVLWMVPVPIQRFLSSIIKVFFPRLGNLMDAMTLSTVELRNTYADIEAYRSEMAGLMVDQKIDALLCPVTVSPALPHVSPSKLFAGTSYTGIFNLLDYAAGSVNVTHVTKQDELDLEDYEESDPWYALAKKGSRGTIGFPIGVQVATPPYKEETCLRIMREIERGVTGK